jgi:hypothetical protein
VRHSSHRRAMKRTDQARVLAEFLMGTPDVRRQSGGPVGASLKSARPGQG